MQKEIFSNKRFKVALDGKIDGEKPLLISVQMQELAQDMPGEILIAPGEVPDLIKALAEAALLAYLNDQKQ